MVVSVDPSLPVGTYRGDIVINADFLSMPAVINVAFEVMAAGSITVKTNSTGAQFSIAGPKDYAGSGTDWSASHVPDGTYTITFTDIDGYRTPASVNKTLSDNGTVTFTGYYTQKRSNEIVVSLEGGKSGSGVKVFSVDGTELSSFTAFDGFRGGVSTAVGDVDGDGTNEIIAGLGGTGNPALIALFDKTGKKLDEFSALNGAEIVRVAAADIDNDGSDEIISVHSDTIIQLITYDGSPAYIDPGISGSFADAADVDGDGSYEIVVASGTEIVIYDVDTSLWTVREASSVAIGDSVQAMSVADIDNDGVDEIIVLSGAGILVLDSERGRSTMELKVRRGKDVVAGDVNADGVMEIIVGSRGGKVMIYGQDGMLLNVVRAFRTKSGATVSLGELGYEK
jgi:hypothetical protein